MVGGVSRSVQESIELLLGLWGMGQAGLGDAERAGGLMERDSAHGAGSFWRSSIG